MRYLIVLLFFLNMSLTNPTQSSGQERPRNWWKLPTGIVLAGIGTFMTIDGFKQIETSEPGLDISDWSWSKEQIISWWADAGGRVTNTGNVPLTDVAIYISYYDVSGQLLTSNWTLLERYWLNPLPENGIDTWHTIDNTGSIEPKWAQISATYNYEKEYKSKSMVEGIGGIGLIIIGSYLIYDYFRELGYFAKLEEKGIDIKLVNKPNQIYLVASARLF